MGFLGSHARPRRRRSTRWRAAPPCSRAPTRRPRSRRCRTPPSDRHLSAAARRRVISAHRCRRPVPYLPELLRRQRSHSGVRRLDRPGSADGHARRDSIAASSTYDAGFSPAQSRRGSLSHARAPRRRGGGARRALADGAAAIAVRAVLCLGAPLRSARPVRPASRLEAALRCRPYTTEKSPPSIAPSRRPSRAAGADALIVVAGDHGVSRSAVTARRHHGVFLTRRPCTSRSTIRFLQRRGGGRARCPRVCDLADIAPTVLESVGMPVPPEMRADLAAAARRRQRTRDDRPVYAESAYPRRAFGWSPLVSWRSDRFLYVKAPRRELRPGQRPGSGAQSRRQPRSCRRRPDDGARLVPARGRAS